MGVYDLKSKPQTGEAGNSLKNKFHGGSPLALKETNEKTMLKEDYTRTTAAYQQNKSALEAFKKKRVNLYEEPSQLLNEDLIRPDSDLI
jgi:hypothetical protein